MKTFKDFYEEDLEYRRENEPKIRKFYDENIKGKSWDEIDPEKWDYYSDWHKEVFGYRPHDNVCGVYINPHSKVEEGY